MTRPRIPHAITDEGAVLMWLPDLERLIYGPQLTLEDASAVDDIFTEARAQLAELAQLAPVVDLDQHRQARAVPRPVDGHRGAR